uniref:Uncharacterized protein n=1 Tax=Lygus hesperus TaxID=30085 RepID=A0A146LG95_LYGHE
MDYLCFEPIFHFTYSPTKTELKTTQNESLLTSPQHSETGNERTPPWKCCSGMKMSNAPTPTPINDHSSLTTVCLSVAYRLFVTIFEFMYQSKDMEFFKTKNLN